MFFVLSGIPWIKYISEEDISFGSEKRIKRVRSSTEEGLQPLFLIENPRNIRLHAFKSIMKNFFTTPYENQTCGMMHEKAGEGRTLLVFRTRV